MRIKTEPSEIYKEYESGVTYNSAIDLYNNVEQNENFFNGKQWEGVNAPNLAKPVFNIIKPVINFYIATLISDDISANIELDTVLLDNTVDIPRVLQTEIENVIEHTNLRYYNRRALRNCAVDGDTCYYIYYDPDVDTGKPYKGEIKVELIDNTNVLYGNPSSEEIDSQPYILLVYRALTEIVKDEAVANGLPDTDIVADGGDSYRFTNSDKDTENDYTTVILKMWKEKGTVRMAKVTETAYVKKPWDTSLKKYPIAYMTWEAVKNSYHGVSPVTSAVPNQIFVNKLYAMSMAFAESQAFPKILYDRSKIPQGWSSKVGQAIAVVGNPNEAIFANFQPAGTNGIASALIQSTIQQTKELMGASDAALGNVKPDNTSAIVATQRAAAAPLDIQRMDFYNFIERCVRVFLDIMRVSYGVRECKVEVGKESEARVIFDFNELDKYNMNLSIDIGQGSYFSELAQISTLDNMLANKIIPDAVTYLEAIPDGYVKNKQRIIDRIEQLSGMAQAVPQQGESVEAQMDRDIRENPMIPEMSDEELAELMTELSQVPAEKKEAVIEALKISDSSKEIIRRFANGGQMQ